MHMWFQMEKASLKGTCLSRGGRNGLCKGPEVRAHLDVSTAAVEGLEGQRGDNSHSLPPRRRI